MQLLSIFEEHFVVLGGGIIEERPDPDRGVARMVRSRIESELRKCGRPIRFDLMLDQLPDPKSRRVPVAIELQRLNNTLQQREGLFPKSPVDGTVAFNPGDHRAKLGDEYRQMHHARRRAGTMKSFSSQPATPT